MDPLTALPPDLYRCVVAFLPPAFTLSRLTCLCHQLSTRITAACFQCGHLTIDDAALAGLVLPSSQPSLDLLSSVPSLSVVYGDASDESDVRRFFDLRCPRRPQLFAFPAVRSLYLDYSVSWDFVNAAPPLEHLLRLLQSAPQSFASLARLHLPTVPDYTDDALSFQPLSCLAALTHLRLDGLSLTASLLSSLLSSLSSLHQLRLLDLSGSLSSAEEEVVAVWSSASITRRLQTLLMPKLGSRPKADSDRMDAFASALACPSSPSCLQYLLPSGSFSALGLLCLLSLPSLTFLDLTSCRISTEEFARFCFSTPQAAAGGAELQGFLSPHLDFLAEEPAVAALYSSSLPLFLSSQRRLRHLRLLCARSEAPVLQPSIAPLQQLRRLEVQGEAMMQELVVDGPLCLPHLTSLLFGSPLLPDAALDALLAACPALLSLELYRCGLESWSLLDLAALRCPCLISIRIRAAIARPATPAVERPPRVAATSGFPQLVTLYLHETSGSGQTETEPVVARCVRLLTEPPCRSLQHLSLSCPSITSHQILALASLPALRLLDCAMLRTEQETAWRAWESAKRKLREGAPAVEEDGAMRGAARGRRGREVENGRERCEERVLPVIAPTADAVTQQSLETAQRWSAGSSIFALHGVEPRAVKQQLCQTLRAMLSERR